MLSAAVFALQLAVALASVADNRIDATVADPTLDSTSSLTPTLGLLKGLESDVKTGGDFHQQFLFQKFQDFIRIYDKTYKDEKEAVARWEYFRENMGKIEKMQAKEQGTAKYGPNQFTDLSAEEFRKNFVSSSPWDLTRKPVRKATLTRKQLLNVPDSWDWRDHGAVTEVKNQGYCGSCWAFSTTGNVEGQWMLKKKKLLSLSEQELVDCDHVDSGCNGGLPSDAYKEIIRMGGLETEKDYPYDGADEKCHLNKTEIQVYINDSVQLSTNETELAAWLFHNGPISIGINANAMQFYWGGVSHPFKFLCNPSNLDHGVLIVGYGTDSGVLGPKPYWTIKNSWGPSWGEKGYYRIYRGDGSCGVNQMCTSALIL